MILQRLVAAAFLLALLSAVAFWLLTRPQRLDAATLAALPRGDAARGELVFWAGGCASCHAAPDAEGEEKLRLGGGRRIVSGFGTFVVPNISSDPSDGIGAWSAADLANAMMRGVSPAGRHYYPAFPYTSYARMDPADVADLRAFLATLPAVPGRAPPHELSFPFDLRRGLGLWKRAFLSDAPVIAVDPADPQLLRGRYLVEGPGHCGECHTPRNRAGGLELSRWMAGGPNPDGPGRIPDITPAGLDGWSAADVAYYLESGFTPDFDTAGGSMVAVQQNMARLPAADRDAIAAYVVALPPRPAAGSGG